MSRKSAAALSIAGAIRDSRLAAPADLTADERALWEDIIDSKPANWFGDETAPVLKEYVRASLMCDALDRRVKDAIAGTGDEKTSVGDVKTLLDMRDKESRRLVSLATKLRLTQQSQYTPKSAATANKQAGGKRPWQTGS